MAKRKAARPIRRKGAASRGAARVSRASRRPAARKAATRRRGRPKKRPAPAFVVRPNRRRRRPARPSAASRPPASRPPVSRPSVNWPRVNAHVLARVGDRDRQLRLLPGAYDDLSVTASTATFSGGARVAVGRGGLGRDRGGVGRGRGLGVFGAGADGAASSPWLAPGRTMMSTIATMTAISPSSTTSRRRRYTCGDCRPVGVRFVDMLTGYGRRARPARGIRSARPAPRRRRSEVLEHARVAEGVLLHAREVEELGDALVVRAHELGVHRGRRSRRPCPRSRGGRRSRPRR